ncbi:MAG: DUF4401 domain-containing protein [Chromatiaceae bacterium]|jgi:hypothetical protein
MSVTDVTLHEIIRTLQAEHLIGADATDYLHSQPEQQPWYIRAMVGLGAWLASLLLIGFVASFSMTMESGFIFIGMALIVGAVLIRRRSENDFLVQSALAASLAGLGLAAYGIADTIGSEEVEIFLGVLLVASGALFFLFPDRIHRVLMVLLATGSLTMQAYRWEMNALVPLLGPAFTAVLILLQMRLPGLVATRFAPLVRPLMNGLMLSAFGTLLLSTLYVLPELGLEYAFYPRPWISTILFGGLFLYVGRLIWPTVVPGADSRTLLVLYGIMATAVVSAWAAPGLLLGLILVMLGAAVGRTTFTAAGIGFFVVFLASYFYGIQVDMLTKSIALTATGVLILIARWAILGVAAGAVPKGPDYA